MTADLSVSMDRDGIVVEIEQKTEQRVSCYTSNGLQSVPSQRVLLLGTTLSPDEARAIASELNDYADQFEANEYQFPSNLGGRR